MIGGAKTELFRELVNVRYKKAQEKSMPLFRTIQWTWFALAMLYICKIDKSIVVATVVTVLYNLSFL